MRVLLALAILATTPAAIPAAAQQPAATTPAKTEKRICKRSAPIGSMIASRKECHTRAEWEKMHQTARNDAGEMMDRRVSSTPSGQ